MFIIRKVYKMHNFFFSTKKKTTHITISNKIKKVT